jgi:hypothetical protein
MVTAQPLKAVGENFALVRRRLREHILEQALV